MDMRFYIENSIERLCKMVNKTTDEIYEQGDITISADDVFAIQMVLSELSNRESTINYLENKLNRKDETIKFFNERIKELKEKEERI